MSEAACIEPGCDLAPRARQRCAAHYQKWRRANLNTVASRNEDPFEGFATRFVELLDEAPSGMFSPAERDLLAAAAFLSLSMARSVIPITPEIRSQVLQAGVDRIKAEQRSLELPAES